MHHGINDWVVQAQWLFAGLPDEVLESEAYQDHSPEKMKEIIEELRKGEADTSNIYNALKTCAYS
jgi:hypothetical protein